MHSRKLFKRSREHVSVCGMLSRPRSEITEKAIIIDWYWLTLIFFPKKKTAVAEVWEGSFIEKKKILLMLNI